MKMLGGKKWTFPSGAGGKKLGAIGAKKLR